MKRLSPREEKVMQVLWQIGEGFVKDVIAQLPEPDTPYNTVSSIIRILEEKGYVGHKAYGRQDVLTANAFYKKAQTELMRSGHPDERRHKMIKQMADVLFGRRRSLDKELMPEDEFNPENNQSLLSKEDEQTLSDIMDENDADDLGAMQDAMMNASQTKNANHAHKSQ